MTDAAQPSGPARLQSAELLRALATVFVVVIHTTHWPGRALLYDDIATLSRFAVPAFMLLTGVLLSYRLGADPLHRGAFLRRRFSRSLIPWLAWAPVQIVFGWFFDVEPAHTVAGVADYVSYGVGHLWFLLLIPQMYLMFVVWPRRNLWLWAAAAMALQTTLCIYRLYGTMPPGLVEDFFLWHGFQLLPFWIGYFAVGVAAGRSLLGRGEPARVNWLAVAVSGAVAVAGGWLLIAVGYDNAPHAGFREGTGGFLLPLEPVFVLGIVAAVWLVGRSVLGLGGGIAWVSRRLSDNSLGVYILHPMLVYAIGRPLLGALNSGLAGSLVSFLALTAGGLGAAALTSMALSRTPLAIAVGMRWRPPRQPRSRLASAAPRGGEGAPRTRA